MRKGKSEETEGQHSEAIAELHPKMVRTQTKAVAIGTERKRGKITMIKRN